MNIEDIAKVVHAANVAYSFCNGDYNHSDWYNTSELIKNSIMSGVKDTIDHILINGYPPLPEDSHNNWMKYKLAEGWTYGEKKSVEKKTHPLLVPYKDLSEVDKTKDSLFLSIVYALMPRE